MSNQLIHQIDNKVFTTGKSVFTFYKSFTLPTIWLRADAGIVKDGDNLVAEWQDQSGNGHHAEQSDHARKPLWVDNGLNGYPVLNFNGSSWVTSLYSTTQPFTSFIVFNFTSFTAQSVVFGGTTGGAEGRCGLQYRDFDGGLLRNYAPTLAQAQYSFNTLNTYILSTGYFNSSSSSILENGNVMASGDIGTNQLNNLGIGRALDARSNPDLSTMNGNVAEFIFYNSLLSDPQRQSVEQYLMAKYAL